MKITELFFICISLVLVPFFANAKPLFLGDSLTYELAMSYKKNHPVDAKFLESTGLNSSQILDWQDYLQYIPISRYDTVYIVLGTNDLIQGSEIELYQGKAERFIKAIKRQNNNVVWLLPPALKSTEKNVLLKNTRRAIINASKKENIAMLDMQNALGDKYTAVINGVQVRSNDGIHITGKGADRVIGHFFSK